MSDTMLTTSIHLSQEAQSLLIKAAAVQHISVEDLASQILNEAIYDRLRAGSQNFEAVIELD